MKHTPRTLALCSGSLARLLAPTLVAAATSFGLAGPAGADPQTDLVAPTAWRWATNVPLTSINDVVNQGYRIVDIEVEDDSPLRFSATFVHNSGPYQKSWWWYYGQTRAQVDSRFAQHNGRLIDVEPYDTSSGQLYAIVLIANSGSDYTPQHGWRTGDTGSALFSWMVANPGYRVIDVQPYLSGTSQRYASIYVTNAGNLQSATWIYMDTTASTIATALQQNNARILDLEPHEGTGRFTALLVPNDGNEWLWFYGISAGDVDHYANQHAGRVIDLERYTLASGFTRFAIVVRRNDNDLTVDATLAMRAHLPLAATSGLLLQEYGATTTTRAGTYEDRIFEPASMMKTVHHFVANRYVAIGAESFANPITVNLGLNGTCPSGTNPSMTTLGWTLDRMMEVSSNTHTEAIRARFGTNTIEGVAAFWGAPNVRINHTHGCLCGQTRNEMTLTDLANIHGAVVGGALGTVRQAFYDRMKNELGDLRMGQYSTQSALDSELQSSSLSTPEIAAFRAGVFVAYKGGSYNCFPTGGSEFHRSLGGYLRIPFRSGCDTVEREYFIGAWVNDADVVTDAENATGVAMMMLFRDRIRAAIDSWEAASCNPFVAYCSALPNSTGVVGQCTASGTSYILRNDLRVHASSLPANSWGILLVARQRGFVSMPGSSMGNLCLGGPITRLTGSLLNSGSFGAMSKNINLNLIQLPTGGFMTIAPGDKLDFQWWHRDQAPGGGATSNYTRGLEVTFI